jgi:SAUR family protein
MTKSKKLNQFLKKLLHMSRYDIQTLSRSSIKGLSSTSSEFSRSWGSSNRSAGYDSVVDANSDCKEECWSSPPQDVPAGSLPVYVGEERRRFVIPMSYLSNNIFRALLEKSEEEYGFRCEGGLRIACSPDVFEHFLWWLEGETTHY